MQACRCADGGLLHIASGRDCPRRLRAYQEEIYQLGSGAVDEVCAFSSYSRFMLYVMMMKTDNAD